MKSELVSEYHKIYCLLEVILAILRITEMIKFKKDPLPGPAMTA